MNNIQTSLAPTVASFRVSCDAGETGQFRYRCAAKQIAEQVEFELETCRRLLGTEPEKVLELLANTPDWSVFLEDEEL